MRFVSASISCLFSVLISDIQIGCDGSLVFVCNEVIFDLVIVITVNDFVAY